MSGRLFKRRRNATATYRYNDVTGSLPLSLGETVGSLAYRPDDGFLRSP